MGYIFKTRSSTFVKKYLFLIFFFCFPVCGPGIEGVKPNNLSLSTIISLFNIPIFHMNPELQLELRLEKILESVLSNLNNQSESTKFLKNQQNTMGQLFKKYLSETSPPILNMLFEYEKTENNLVKFWSFITKKVCKDITNQKSKIEKSSNDELVDDETFFPEYFESILERLSGFSYSSDHPVPEDISHKPHNEIIEGILSLKYDKVVNDSIIAFAYTWYIISYIINFSSRNIDLKALSENEIIKEDVNYCYLKKNDKSKLLGLILENLNKMYLNPDIILRR